MTRQLSVDRARIAGLVALAAFVAGCGGSSPAKTKTDGGAGSGGSAAGSGGAAGGGAGSRGSAAGSTGSGGAAGGGPGSGGSAAGSTGIGGGAACPSAQTQFGNIAQGDSNPYFTSSVGVRTGSQLLVFSGYNGPAATADGGASVDGGGNVNLIYWQAFDPATAKSVGPARPLALTDSTSAGSIYLYDASIAPTGEIAVLYSHLDSVHALASGLSVAFLAWAPRTTEIHGRNEGPNLSAGQNQENLSGT